MLGFAAVFALLPKLQKAHDLPTKSLGLITATSVIMSVITQLSLARFADRGHSPVLADSASLHGLAQTTHRLLQRSEAAPR